MNELAKTKMRVFLVMENIVELGKVSIIVELAFGAFIYITREL